MAEDGGTRGPPLAGPAPRRPAVVPVAAPRPVLPASQRPRAGLAMIAEPLPGHLLST